MAGTALVTGGSGYIAGFLIRQLIANGWTVNTTVRNLKRESEVRGWLNVPADKLRFFAADLEQDSGWAEAMAGVTVLHHVASPFVIRPPRDRQLLIGPAVAGTRRAVAAALGAGVSRVVVTSSMAAIASSRSVRLPRATPGSLSPPAGRELG